MTRTPVIFKKATTTNPVEFWIKTSNNGTQRAHYYHGRKMPVALDIALLAESLGTAVRVTEPEF